MLRGFITVLLVLAFPSARLNGQEKPLVARGGKTGDRILFLAPARSDDLHRWAVFVDDYDQPVLSEQSKPIAELRTVPTSNLRAGSVISVVYYNRENSVIGIQSSTIEGAQSNSSGSGVPQLLPALVGAGLGVLGVFLGAWLTGERERRRERRGLKAALRLWIERELRHLRCVQEKQVELNAPGALQVPAWLYGQNFPLYAGALDYIDAAKIMEKAEAIFLGVKRGGTLQETSEQLQALLEEIQLAS